MKLGAIALCVDDMEKMVQLNRTDCESVILLIRKGI